MSVATFYVRPASDPLASHSEFVCVECDVAVTPPESDVHATRKHKAAQIRVFNSKAAYDDWEAVKAALGQTEWGSRG